MEKRKLRIGLLLDDYNIAAWMLKMIENIACSNYAEISLAIINNNVQPAQRNKTLISKLINNKGRIGTLALRKLLEIVYTKLIERRTYLPDACELMNCEALLVDTPTLHLKTKQNKSSDYFYDDDIKKIKEYNIDILIRGGFGILRGGILSSANYGVWSFHHGDNTINRGGPAGFWESMQSWPETGTILQILTEDLDGGLALYRSFSCTDNMSVKDNINSCYWKSISFMTRKILELYNTGGEAFLENVRRENRHPSFYSERLYKSPTNYELTKLTIKKVLEKALLLYENHVFVKQWILMFHLKDSFSTSLWRYKKIFPPKDRFWADPHVIYRDNKYYIFIEEYIYNLGKAHISVITMDESGSYGNPEVVLSKPYHLSYPFVFEYCNNYYMIPESESNKTIELYKAIDFPYKWEFQMNIMEDVRAVDATLFRHNGKWWLFANIIENEGASSWDELFLFYSSDLFSKDWQPHPLNPIVSDCKSARSAGKIFFENEALYRPSQNCSTRYGYGFNLHEITEIDENKYTEKLVSRVKPNWDEGIIATHTFNRVKSLHIIDARYKRRK